MSRHLPRHAWLLDFLRRRAEQVKSLVPEKLQKPFPQACKFSFRSGARVSVPEKVGRGDIRRLLFVAAPCVSVGKRPMGRSLEMLSWRPLSSNRFGALCF